MILGRHQHFRGACCIYLQGDGIVLVDTEVIQRRKIVGQVI